MKNDYFMPECEQSIGNLRTEETRAAKDQYTHGLSLSSTHVLRCRGVCLLVLAKYRYRTKRSSTAQRLSVVSD
jgi:hypothetical protein